jgi:hypothetical protein
VVTGGAEVHNVDDIAVLHRGGDAGLSHELVYQTRAVSIVTRGEQLDGDPALEREILGAPYGCQAALADERVQPITPRNNGGVFGDFHNTAV